MEKGVSQASHKVYKTDKKHENSLLKALRPKVYITDSSKFKKLVQELTGNGTKPISPSTPPTKELNDIPELQIKNHRKPESRLEFSAYSPELSLDIEDYREPESSLEFSADSPNLSMHTFSPMSPLAAFMDSQSSRTYTKTDALPFQGLESYDSFPLFDGYSFQNDQELCISDYDLSDICNRF
ncbi:VQ [Macleaya cordata]|uniref:VQ n=1 Tax=Macleaya cordata TaxID=56857 RepID=A0A200R159_MACCD|nr:VQ [Macleaya cordata]